MSKVVFYSGITPDLRVQEKKDQDWRPEEAFAPQPIEWKEKSVKEIEKEIKATSISQGITSRCVSEYAGIFFEVAEFQESGNRIVFSRRDVYGRRANFPQAGMNMPDLFKIMRDGACLEVQLPSTDKYEWEIDKPYTVTEEMKIVRAKYAALSSFTWKKFTIDDIAQMINQGVPVCLFWYFARDLNEWWKNQPEVLRPTLGVYESGTDRHHAAGMVFHKRNGKKIITVMDSAGQGTGYGKQKNLRDITEDFFNERCYAAGFAIDKENLDYKPDTDLRYIFTRNLRNGDDGYDVRMLQKILVAEGCLAIKTPTIHFRGMTEAGVKKLQEKYADEILKPLGLKKGTGLFLESTRKFINKKYNA